MCNFEQRKGAEIGAEASCLRATFSCDDQTPPDAYLVTPKMGSVP